MTMEDVPNTDHFSIIENLVDGEYHLTKVEHTHQTQLRTPDDSSYTRIVMNALRKMSGVLIHVHSFVPL